MRKLGFPRFGRSTAARILKRHGLTPARRHSTGLSWSEFLGHYGRFVWASDFLTVTTATLRIYYVVFFLEINTWRITHWNVSPYLERLLREFIEHYYHPARPHQGLAGERPLPQAPPGKGELIAIPVVGGLHHRYYRAAA